MPESPLVAADTNVFLDLARGDEVILDCFEVLKRRLHPSAVLVLPTVIHELADLAEDAEQANTKRVAKLALRSILHPWGFVPVNCVPVGHGIVEQIARRLRDQRLLPESEVNDSYIVAEAGLVGAKLLLSSDSHLTQLSYEALRLVMDACDVQVPLIASPWRIVHKFFQ